MWTEVMDIRFQQEVLETEKGDPTLWAFYYARHLLSVSHEDRYGMIRSFIQAGANAEALGNAAFLEVALRHTRLREFDNMSLDELRGTLLTAETMSDEERPQWSEAFWMAAFEYGREEGTQEEKQSLAALERHKEKKTMPEFRNQSPSEPFPWWMVLIPVTFVAIGAWIIVFG